MEKEGEGEKHQCVVASHTLWPLLGTWPATQACAVTGNRTGSLSVCRMATQSTEPHQPGQGTLFFKGLYFLLYKRCMLAILKH